MKLVVYHGLNGAKDREAKAEAWAKGQYSPIEHFSEAPHDNWTAFRAAVERARELDALLLIPRRGNLGKSPSMLQLLRGVKFKVLDKPLNAHTLTQAIDAAEDHLSRMARRVRETMLERSAQGVKFGAAVYRPTKKAMRKLAAAGTIASAAKRSEKARKAYESVLPEMLRRREAGETYEAITEWLNSKQLRTTRGNPFTIKTTYNIIQRASERHEHAQANGNR